MNTINKSIGRESGAILVVALIMLIIITIVGLSTIGSTGLEVKMAANAQFKNMAFQGSEHAIEETSVDRRFLGTVLIQSNLATPIWPTKIISTASQDNDQLNSNSLVKYAGNADLNADGGNSDNEGSSRGVLHNFEVYGIASIANTGALNTNVRGLYVEGPKN